MKESEKVLKMVLEIIRNLENKTGEKLLIEFYRSSSNFRKLISEVNNG